MLGSYVSVVVKLTRKWEGGIWIWQDSDRVIHTMQPQSLSVALYEVQSIKINAIYIENQECLHACLFDIIMYVKKCSHFSSLFISRTNTLLLDTHTQQ